MSARCEATTARSAASASMTSASTPSPPRQLSKYWDLVACPLCSNSHTSRSRKSNCTVLEPALGRLADVGRAALGVVTVVFPPARGHRRHGDLSWLVPPPLRPARDAVVRGGVT